MRTLFVGSLIAMLCSGCGTTHPEGTPVKVEPTRLQVSSLQPSPVDQVYEASGTVRAGQRAVLASKLQGSVLSVSVQLGSSVPAGQLLVELDHGETDAAASRAQAASKAAGDGVVRAQKAREAAEAEARLASLTYERYQQLLEKRSVSQQEFDQAAARNTSAAAAVEMAQAAVQQAQAQQDDAAAAMEAARIRQSYARVTAPFAGFVAEKNVDAGSVVFPGTPLLTLEESRGYQLEVSLPESHAASVRIGDTARVSIAAIQLDTPARVAELQPGAEPGSRTSLIRLSLPETRGLRSGLFGRALFSTGKAELLVVPRSAVQRQGQLTSVFVVTDGAARRRLVTLGREYGDTVEVLSGLAPGETVVSAPPSSLADGAPVEIQQ
jgi:multidrug efflux pump subunit AcrA (membrane-fusion protein)